VQPPKLIAHKESWGLQLSTGTRVWGSRTESSWWNIRYRTDVVILVSMVSDVLIKKYWGFGIKGSIRNSYIGATINHPQTPPDITPNMASAADDSKLPSLSSPVPLCRNDSQRYMDGLPQLFSGQNRPVAATATGKHRHDTSTTPRTRRAIT
jgi:hypothetical protein